MNLNNLEDTMSKLLNAYENIRYIYPDENPTEVFNRQLITSTSFTSEEKEKLLCIWNLILVELALNGEKNN